MKSMPGEDALAVRIANEIGSLIDAGEISHDSHLSTQKLADRFDVSRTPVRDALEILATRGVVEQQPNRGYFARKNDEGQSRGATNSAGISLDAPAVYYDFAEDWLNDQIPSEVTEQFLATRYGLSRKQLATILTRAANEGWIERKAGYGWRLLPVAKGPEALQQIYRFRMIIEPAALLEPTFLLDRPVAEDLRVTLQDLLDGCINEWPVDRLHKFGVEFHQSLMQMSGNPFLLQSLQRANRFRELLEYRSMGQRRRYFDETNEHLEILERIIEGDAASASYLMRAHLQKAVDRKQADSRNDAPNRKADLD